MRSFPLRLMILGWLITWISTIPLYHFHIPDTTDRWSVLHSGGAHTVFTPDLVGEYSPPFKESGPAHSTRLSQRIVNSPELGIAILDQKSKHKEQNILGTRYHFLDDQPLFRWAIEFPEERSKDRLYHLFLASRAPPRTVCV
jgi:hypothetical protein